MRDQEKQEADVSNEAGDAECDLDGCSVHESGPPDLTRYTVATIR